MRHMKQALCCYETKTIVGLDFLDLITPAGKLHSRHPNKLTSNDLCLSFFLSLPVRTANNLKFAETFYYYSFIIIIITGAGVATDYSTCWREAGAGRERALYFSARRLHQQQVVAPPRPPPPSTAHSRIETNSTRHKWHLASVIYPTCEPALESPRL